MFHIVNPNTVYNIVNGTRIELFLNKEKEKYDIAQFLDDISLWMEDKQDIVSSKFLPFCVLSVGIAPMQVSAFMYGLFVGRALEKHGLKITSKETKVDKETILKEIEKSINYYNGLLGNNIKDNFEENGNGRNK